MRGSGFATTVSCDVRQAAGEDGMNGIGCGAAGEPQNIQHLLPEFQARLDFRCCIVDQDHLNLLQPRGVSRDGKHLPAAIGSPFCTRICRHFSLLHGSRVSGRWGNSLYSKGPETCTATRYPHNASGRMIHQTRLPLSTQGYRHMQDITQAVAEIVMRSGVKTGIVHLFNIGSTAALGTIEFEPGLQTDFPEMLDRLIPPSRDYAHEQTWHDGNGHSHLQASLARTVPVGTDRQQPPRARHLAADLSSGM